MALAAGKQLECWRRLLTALCAVVTLCAEAAPPLQNRDAAASGAGNLLAPNGYIVGGFSSPAAIEPGRPPTGPYIKLAYPSALAAHGPDLYVADSGQRTLLRIDTVSQSVTQLRELPPFAGVRLKTGPDGSVYVLRPDRGEVERLARDGRRLATFASKYEILQPADLIVEPTLNRVWISDAAGGVFAFHPSGRMSEPLAGRGDGFGDDLSAATLLAAGPNNIYGIDPRCRCVIEFDEDGAVIGRFGEGGLATPVDLAVDTYGRAWVLDRGDHRLKVFANGQIVGAIPATQLGLSNLTAISIDRFLAYVADGPGGRIGIFAILPPSRRTP
ncbi:hypothetical protein GPA25_13315 [Aromatoleum diolicum]|uniref:NHL repeat-containing protein n=1 Tax=Aromatoleum diolicum TaxID=75796 RepID=A0ABX1QE06_9RHOO|nr:hypothetical protein [Aromatoleum diolicum]NMG75740.1 hypothetical protein [Aromatoleum diolicum]